MHPGFLKTGFFVFLLAIISGGVAAVYAEEWKLTGYDIAVLEYQERNFPKVLDGLYFEEERTGEFLVLSGNSPASDDSPCFSQMVYQWCPGFEGNSAKVTFFKTNTTYSYFNLDFSPLKCVGTAGYMSKTEPCFIRVERTVGTKCLLVIGRLPESGVILQDEKIIIPCPKKMVAH